MKHVEKLDIQFDSKDLINGLNTILDICQWHPDHRQIGLTHSLDSDATSAWYDGVGSLRYTWGSTPFDIDHKLKENEIIQKESDFTQFVKEFNHTIFRDIYNILSNSYNLGRVRLMYSKPKTCLSWHTDTQKRLHIPIITNIGAHLVIEDTANHMPADGSVYIANTTLFHTAFNAGLEPRIHLVACLLD